MKTRISISSGGGGGGASAFFSSSPPSFFPSTSPPPSFPSSAFFSSFFSSLALGFSSTAAAGSFFPCSAFFASYHETIHLLHKIPTWSSKITKKQLKMEQNQKRDQLRTSPISLTLRSCCPGSTPAIETRNQKLLLTFPRLSLAAPLSLSLSLEQVSVYPADSGQQAANVSIRDVEAGTCETDG